MAEPVSSSGAVAVAAGAVTVTGTIFGVQYDALLAGFFGGLVALSYLPPMSYPRVAGSVASSAVLAGFFAPVLAAAGLNYLPWLREIGDYARLASAAGLGLTAQVLMPTIFNAIRKRGAEALSLPDQPKRGGE
jgi:hypothetical protein